MLLQMISNNLGAILSKQKQLKPVFKIFIKPFQEQLKFIESIIEHDADEIKNQSRCCYCIIKRFTFSKDKFIKFQMFNPTFYKVFTLMTRQERQLYFLQLLDYIEDVDKFYKYFTQKGKHEKMNINKYKTKLQSKLIDKLVSKDILNKLQKQQEEMRSFQLKANLNGIIHRKIGRFINYKLLLIEKVNGEQVKIVMDLRNYLIIDCCKQMKSLTFYAIYESLHPISMHLEFVQQKQTIISNFDRYFQIFQEMMKIGKIEKLVQNIDLSELFKKNGDKRQANQHNLMMQTFVKTEDQQGQSDHESVFLNSEDIMKSSIVGKMKHVKRQQTIKAIDRYQQIKKKVIQTLNFLAEKREAENKKIQLFLNREAIKEPKIKSPAILRALKNPQSFVPRKTEAQQILGSVKEAALFFLNLQQPQQSYLSVINNGPLNQKKMQFKHDSFYQDCNENQSQDSKKFYEIFKRNGQLERKIQYKKNMFVKFYGIEYEFNLIESLMDMIRIQLTDHIYLMPEAKILSQFTNLKDEKIAKFKVNWFQKLTKSAKIYCRKSSPTFLKIFIKVDIQIKSLIQALVNIEAYPFWHPNIKKIEIKQAITSENTIHYKIQMINPITNKLKTQQFLLHLFKFQNKYYIIQKRLQGNENQKQKTNKGLFSYFNFMKSTISYSKLTFLMIKVSNISKNGFCQMVISLDYNPVNQKQSDLAQKEIITFFMNFIFIKDYWKLQKQQKVFGDSIFTLDWIVSKNSFNYISQELIKQKQDEIQDNFQDLKMDKQLSLISTLKKGTVQSSSQLIHSEQFFDM